jgi:DNA-binding LacI/PurR family transcriptional regulator
MCPADPTTSDMASNEPQSVPHPSIYHLADELGVSASTVSRVLNQRGGIGVATRRRVLERARAAGFRPRMTARQRTVAVVVDRYQYAAFGGFVPCLLSSLVQALSKHALAVELVTEHNRSRLDERLIDGVLAMAWDDATIDAVRRLRGDVPVVTLNRMDVPQFSAVSTDHRRDGEMAVDYLAARGHRRVAMVVEERDNWGSRQRIEGFVGRLRELGLLAASEGEQAVVASTEHQPMYGLLRRLLAGTDPRPTGIFVANENMGLEATYIVRDVLGLRVPQDLSLIGMESPHVSQFLSPPLTAIAQPLDQLAERSLSVLLERLDGGRDRDEEPVRVVLQNSLVERESVGTIPGAEPLKTQPSRDL